LGHRPGAFSNQATAPGWKSGQDRGQQLAGPELQRGAVFPPPASAAGDIGYDGASSGGSNWGLCPKLIDQVKERVDKYRSVNNLTAATRVPADAVTTPAAAWTAHQFT